MSDNPFITQNPETKEWHMLNKDMDLLHYCKNEMYELTVKFWSKICYIVINYDKILNEQIMKLSVCVCVSLYLGRFISNSLIVHMK